MILSRKSLIASALLLAAAAPTFASPVAKTSTTQKQKTERVIVLMLDGLRWQEVFNGADSTLMNKENGSVKDIDALKKKYWRETPEARRETLMPFFWQVISREGQLHGNKTLGSSVTVTNKLNFSYPGYNETLTGYVDPKVNSNDKIPNQNKTVFEWLNSLPQFNGSVAAFGAWDVFPSIFNVERCGFPVNAGYEPFTLLPGNPVIDAMNALKRDMPRRWGGEPYDAITFQTAMEYLKVKKPKVFFLSLGETDEWAHEGEYDRYLDSAQMSDRLFGELWSTVQKMPEYRGKTTLIIATDHGRGGAPRGWESHGANIGGAEDIWLAVLGPDTPALGEIKSSKVTQSQIAATIAKALGKNYSQVQPRAAVPAPVFNR